MSNILSRFGNSLINFAQATGADLPPEVQKKIQQRNLAQLGSVLTGDQIPEFLRPGGTEEMTPEAFDSARARQLFALGTPEAARAGMQFIETPESKLNKSNIESQIAERQQMNDIRRQQVALQKEELAITKEDKLRNYNLAAKELEAKLKMGDPKEIFDRETKLRNEFVTQSKDFITQRDAYDRILEAADKPSAAGDIALIYGFMKLNDPGSTVREGEYATAQNAGSIPDRVRSYYNKALNGERLDSKVRGDFVNRSKKLFSSTQRQHDKRVTEYTGLAQRAGADPKQVILDLDLAGKASKETSPSGVIKLDENFNVVQ